MLIGALTWAPAKREQFVKVRNGQFELEGKPYRFIGINYWPAGILGMANLPGNRARLEKELDFLASQGITNLRVLALSEGDSSYPYRISPSSQPYKNQVQQEYLEGLDFLLQQCGRRKLKVVLYLTNQWEWSGGMGQYLEWAGFGKPPLPKSSNWSWDGYCRYMAQFYDCEPCQSELNNQITKLVTRKNTLTGVMYKDDPTLFSWELCNEPRPMKKEAMAAFHTWIQKSALLIKQLDPNHMVTLGSEGDVAYGYQMNAFETDHSLPEVDYLTIHIWPKNWNWFADTSIAVSYPTLLQKSEDYLKRHLETATRLHKPLVLEEFGLPRDGHQFAEFTSVASRNRYFYWGLNTWRKNDKPLAGISFWAFGGITWFPLHGEFWKKGEPFRGDPPQEEQGLNSLYASDSSTWQLIRSFSRPK